MEQQCPFGDSCLFWMLNREKSCSEGYEMQESLQKSADATVCGAGEGQGAEGAVCRDPERPQVARLRSRAHRR